jgi:hypothetical protein
MNPTPTPIPARPMGRVTPSPVQWARLVRSVGMAPRLFRGVAPRKADVSRYRPPIPWYQLRGFCLAPGSPVLMADGSEVPIESVGIGDRVVTHNGAPGVVRRSFRQEWAGPLVEVRPLGGRTVVATPDHPFLVIRRGEQLWSRAVNLEPGDGLVGFRVRGGVPERHDTFLDGKRTVYAGRCDVVNIEVDVAAGHSFVAGGVATHNCVGWTLAMCQTMIRSIPWRVARDGTVLPADPAAPPQYPADPCSPLYAYDVSRIEAAAEGIDMGHDPGPGGDGSIVSCALKASETWGTALWSEDPADPEHEQSHRNGTRPTDAQARAAMTRKCTIGLCQDLQHGLELLGSLGIPLDVGAPIPEGFLHADARGFVDLSGPVVGGHSFGIYGYDYDKDIIIYGNNWEDWGWRDPAAPGGYSNMAYGSLSEALRWFAPARLRTGECEVGAVHVVAGFDQPLVDIDFAGL